MLDKIKSPKDIKNLSLEELSTLAEEIREFLLSNISQTGGHLASNLGVVELTIALHRCLDCPKDHLVWDVGHQSYVHKILTGRQAGFLNLRQRDGMSGFPDPKESEFDLFKTGHASTSISSAMGLAEANKRLKNKKKTVAVIGDGSFTGGLALEAINQIGYLQTPMIIVMNDNRMSISENVGALSRYTKRIEKTEVYQDIKQMFSDLEKKCCRDDQACFRDVRSLKKAFKQVGSPGLLFEKLGLHYIGPIDGHCIGELEKALKEASAYSEPVLVHVRTKKGMGYSFAEERSEKFHGVSPFIKENGEKKSCGKSFSYTDAFSEKVLELAKKDKKIIGITAAMPSGTGLNLLANELPGQFFDVGICESHAVTFAAGLAKNGLKPVVAIYSSFMQRALDQVIHDVCLQNLPVVFALDRAGLVGEDGPTHHGVFDLSFLRFIPNLTVMAVRDERELQDALDFAFKLGKPVVIRYPRGCSGEKLVKVEKRTPFKLGGAEFIKKGKGTTFISIGNQLNRAFLESEKEADSSLINARFVKPLDPEIIKQVEISGKAVIFEDNAKIGGFAAAVLEQLAKNNVKAKVRSVGIEDEFVAHGKVEDLREDFIV